MVGNNSVYAQIQKRRRRSVPTSPASPSAPWRSLDTGEMNPDVSTHEETSHSATASGQSPALSIDVPSPTFNLSSSSPISPTSPTKDPRDRSIASLSPLSEEYPQRQLRHVEQPRPATSAAHIPGFEHLQIGKRRVFPSSSLDVSGGSPRPTSSNGAESRVYDFGIKQGDRAGVANRNLSHSSLLVDHSTGEDLQGKGAGLKKSRLNLLNPMSLLARRRSSQNQPKNDDVGLSANTVPAIPDDYDPRIRGNIFHDFSAPRPRKVPSSTEAANDLIRLQNERQTVVGFRSASEVPGLADLPASRNVQSPKHSPIFREHFQDDRKSLQPGQTGYLHSLVASDMLRKNGEIATLPAFAKKLPPMIPEKTELRDDFVSSSITQESFEGIEECNAAAAPELAELAFSEKERAVPWQKPHHPRTSSIPKHMTSTSSRFSFLGNVDSAAQEKLLEERHKNRVTSDDFDTGDQGEDPEDEDYNDYDLDTDDGFEEKIPGINTDAKDDENGVQSGALLDGNLSKQPSVLRIDSVAANELTRRGNLHNFHFTPESPVLSTNGTTLTSAPTPRDENGQIIGLADTSYSPNRVAEHHYQSNHHQDLKAARSLAGLGLTSIESGAFQALSAPTQLPVGLREPFTDEDLYFDDGEFDDLTGEDGEGVFDEHVFDDGSEQIHDIPAQNAKRLELAQRLSSSGQATLDARNDIQQRVGKTGADHQDLHSTELRTDHSAGLTEDNLAAYHAALVSATDTAEARGRFARSLSDSRHSDDHISQSRIEDSPPGLSADDKRLSHTLDISGIEEDDGFPFDDDGEDDLMIAEAIAEANAEVLENDDDGFYGQEFGFYARAHGKNSSDLEYGGYFASRGSNGIKRSHSAKANFQEPSLTPITERSEWSTRNSVASLQILGIPGSAQSIPSPGIAQLLDFESSTFDEEVAMSALMKLRRGAFGGSSTSVNSLGGSHSGSSPLGHVSSHSFSGPDQSHKTASSMQSLPGSIGIPESEAEEGEFGTEPLTVIRNTITMRPSDSDPATPDSWTAFSPLSHRSDHRKFSHSRNSSGAESVSYVRDPDGRWLLERRRTGDDGGEVIGREYLDGARI